jgi:predicted DCC family thiol-disulfide oxidoreductase YuxK
MDLDRSRHASSSGGTIKAGQMSDFHLIYDGGCGFCVKAMRLFGALDVRRRLVFHDARLRPEVFGQFPALRDADLDDAMFAVHRSGISRGFFAMRQLIWQSPLTWLLLPLFYAPGASWAGPRLYQWIAGNRHKLGCGDHCEMATRR